MEWLELSLGIELAAIMLQSSLEIELIGSNLAERARIEIALQGHRNDPLKGFFS